MKIATLYAGATEYVCALGQRDHLVAVSHECDHPADVADLPRVTRTTVDPEKPSGDINAQVQAAVAAEQSLYEVDLDVLRDTGADTLITQEQCGVCAVSPADFQEGLSQKLGRDVRVLSLCPATYQDILDDVLKVGEFLGAGEQAKALHEDWTKRTQAIQRETRKQRALVRTLILEWLDPPMAGGHWNAEMVGICGGDHAMNLSGPAKVTTWEDIVAFHPQCILVIPCGFGLQRAMEEFKALPPMPAGWDDIFAVRMGRLYAVDGNAYFNRTGPRMVDSLELMAELLHPEKFAGWFKDRPRRQAARQIRLDR